LQCAAVCCRVLQCVGVLQCAAVCCRVLQSVAECCSVLQCVAVCVNAFLWCCRRYNRRKGAVEASLVNLSTRKQKTAPSACADAVLLLQRVAACCSVLQRVAACCSVLQRVAVCWYADAAILQTRFVTAKLVGAISSTKAILHESVF